LLLFEVVSTQVPLQSVPDVQTQLVAVPEQILPVPHDPLTQCPLESHVWGTPALHCELVGVQSAQAPWTQVQVCVLCEQVPWLLHVPASWKVVELTQPALPQAVLTGNTHSAPEPVQVEAQLPWPLHDLPGCGEVVFVHVPCVTEHDWQVPLHALSQQYPSTQLPVEHSVLSEQESPFTFRGAHVVPAQYLPVPHDIPTQLPAQSLPSVAQELLSQLVVVWAWQLPLLSHKALFVRTPPVQL
jgi:hypothetical protein